MNRRNNFDVKGWMVVDLKLKGNELMTFAIIHGFSQDGESEFKGSVFYIREFLSVSKPTAIKILHGLIEKGFVLVRKEPCERGMRNVYKVDFDGLNNFTRRGKETLPTTGKETLPKNIHNKNIHKNTNLNNSNSLIDFKKEEKPTKENYVWPSSDWQELWNEWIDFRKREKKPRFKSVKTENIAKNKLVKDSGANLQTAIKMVENSISNNYQGIFKLKNNNQKNEARDYTKKILGY